MTAILIPLNPAMFNPLGFALTVAVGVGAYYLSEHTKNKRKSIHDKHTKPRAGRSTTKNRQKPS